MELKDVYTNAAEGNKKLMRALLTFLGYMLKSIKYREFRSTEYENGTIEKVMFIQTYAAPHLWKVKAYQKLAKMAGKNHMERLEILCGNKVVQITLRRPGYVNQPYGEFSISIRTYINLAPNPGVVKKHLQW